MKKPVQKPGSLPEGCNLDSMLTPEQMAIWQQVPSSTFRKRMGTMAGRVVYSRKCVRFHPRTHLAQKVKT